MPTFTLWIEAELWQGKWDASNENTNVIVTLEDGSRWAVAFFTYANIHSIVEEYKSTGECLHGKYFWDSDIVLVDEISRARIHEVVAHLLMEGEFTQIFARCEQA